MNWKRGLFRMWIVMSFVWVLGTIVVMLIASSEQRHYPITEVSTAQPETAWEPMERFHAKHGGESGEIIIEQRTARELLERLKAQDRGESGEIIKEARLPDGTVVEFPGDMADEEIQSVLDREFGAPFPWQILILTVAVPLALLVIGRVGFWIVAGFKP